MEHAQQPSIHLPPNGSRIAEKYIIEKELGRGGMGAVFLARHEVTGRPVAIKWMLPTFAHDAQAVARFVREAKLAAAVNHENVVDIYDVGSSETGFYLIMEFLRGRSLADRLEQGPMTLPEFLEVIRGVCAGLGAAHQAGIVHRDLKPDNIFLAQARNDSASVIPKIVDFGVSKAATHTDSHARLTGTGVAMGTPHYMSPEQVYSAADAGPTSDIYSLGVIAYEALSGAMPHDGETVAAIIVRVATEEPVPIRSLVPGLDPDVANAIHRALAKRPQDRYQTVDEFFSALSGRNTLSDALAATIATPTAFQSAAGDVRGGATGPFPLPASAEAPGPSTVEVKQLAFGPSRRRRTALALSALLIAALAIAGLAVAFGREAAPATPAPEAAAQMVQDLPGGTSAASLPVGAEPPSQVVPTQPLVGVPSAPQQPVQPPASAPTGPTRASRTSSMQESAPANPSAAAARTAASTPTAAPAAPAPPEPSPAAAPAQPPTPRSEPAGSNPRSRLNIVPEDF